MREIVYSRTFVTQLAEYIDRGERVFGVPVATEKKFRVFDTIESVIAPNPALKAYDPKIGLVVYPISGTPFFVLYDYDEAELRLHYVFIRGKPISDIDPDAAEW